MANDTLRPGLGRVAGPGPGDDPAGSTRTSEEVQRAVVAPVDETLSDFLAAEIYALGELDPALTPFATVVRDLVFSGGKRLRPSFASAPCTR